MSEWQPIETAPKDGKAILLYSDKWPRCAAGFWTDDRFSARPKPLWVSDFERLYGLRWQRLTQPTHWQPLPLPPPPEVK